LVNFLRGQGADATSATVPRRVSAPADGEGPMLACWQSAGSLREPDLRRLQPSLDLQTGCPRVGQQGAPVFVAGVFSPPPWLIAAGGCCLDGVWRAPGGDILMDCRGTGSAEGGPPRRSGRHRAALAGAGWPPPAASATPAAGRCRRSSRTRGTRPSSCRARRRASPGRPLSKLGSGGRYVTRTHELM
jgi:hypothetical protein